MKKKNYQHDFKKIINIIGLCTTSTLPNGKNKSTLAKCYNTVSNRGDLKCKNMKGLTAKKAKG